MCICVRRTPTLLYHWLHFATDADFYHKLIWTYKLNWKQWLFFTKKCKNKKTHQRKKTFERSSLDVLGLNWGQRSFWDPYRTWHLKDEGFWLLSPVFFVCISPIKETSWARYWSVFERHKVVDTMYFLQWRQTTNRESNWTIVAEHT